jgi:hypothetical protein
MVCGQGWLVAQFLKMLKLITCVSNMNRRYRTFIRTGVRKAKTANWIQDLIKRLQNSTQLIHSQFDAFKSKQVYTFEGKIRQGGTIYYESASRQDLVLKDYIFSS